MLEFQFIPSNDVTVYLVVLCRVLSLRAKFMESQDSTVAPALLVHICPHLHYFVNAELLTTPCPGLRPRLVPNLHVNGVTFPTIYFSLCEPFEAS